MHLTGIQASLITTNNDDFRRKKKTKEILKSTQRAADKVRKMYS